MQSGVSSVISTGLVRARPCIALPTRLLMVPSALHPSPRAGGAAAPGPGEPGSHKRPAAGDPLAPAPGRAAVGSKHRPAGYGAPLIPLCPSAASCTAPCSRQLPFPLSRSRVLARTHAPRPPPRRCPVDSGAPPVREHRSRRRRRPAVRRCPARAPWLRPSPRRGGPGVRPSVRGRLRGPPARARPRRLARRAPRQQRPRRAPGAAHAQPHRRRHRRRCRLV